MSGYVELHARSAFSFLRGGTAPEQLVEAAIGRGLPAMALCDRGGVYGMVRFHQGAREKGLRPIVGCELRMEDETVIPVLASSQAGYRRLCALLTTANLRAPKDEGRIGWKELSENTEGLYALTGDSEGPVRRAWAGQGVMGAVAAGEMLVRAFPGRLYAEIQRHLTDGEEDENEFIVDWARATKIPLLATNGVLYGTRGGRDVLDVFTCLREHTSLDGAGRRLARNGERHVKDAVTMSAVFGDLPEAISNTERLAERLEFSLDQLGYQFPDYPTPDREPQGIFLRKRTYEGARERYGELTDQVTRQLERELELIIRLGFSGYFLIVWDLCRFARSQGILVQGRGSAANSAVCYSLGITAVDPIGSKLLFERFLSEGRTDWPDIDLDLPSEERREAVIQEVYRRYSRTGAALVANVVSYRGRNTMREVGKVFGFPDDVLDRFSSLFHGGDYPQTLELQEQLKIAGVSSEHPRLRQLLSTCQQVYGLPRHLSQHPGGMVLSAGNLSQFVPLENARMPGRSVMQWDKNDVEDMKMVKIDLLGLGMMAALQECLTICEQRGQPVDLAKLPKDDPKVFAMVQEADTVGVFQIESRAQMATLPRMRPETFYDLAIEVALIRPGPIQGHATNPYLDRRNGKAPVTYPDERVKPILERTLGVVLFQEQILRVAMELGGFTASEADELRRAIGFTRSQERLNKMKEKLRSALLANRCTAEATESIVNSLASFALYGFPESHAISFALIAYASAWFKAHRPAVFLAALLNAQPMGFYSSASLVHDAQRHGLRTLPPCVMNSEAGAIVTADETIRLGLGSLKGVKAKPIAQMLEERKTRPFSSLTDFLRRTNFNPAERRTLARSGALNGLAGDRRSALWKVEALHEEDDLFRYAGDEPNELSPLERMTHLERLQSDYATLGMTAGRHPMALMRNRLHGVSRAIDLKDLRPGLLVQIAGSVITRQRPGTAKGFCFITLEDETSHANAIVRPQLFETARLIINMEPALLITGRLQNEMGVIHVMAEQIERLPAVGMPEQASHDYR